MFKGQTEGAIVLVAKAPLPGVVKTRLCPPLNYYQAAELYGGFLLDTIALSLEVSNASVYLICPTNEDAYLLRKFVPDQVRCLVQRGVGLTGGLMDAFRQGLALGHRKVLGISSDNPTLPSAYLSDAFKLLDKNEVVLGPADDGGYYLIGAKTLYPGLFEGMTWSTDRVLAETLERVRQAHLTCELLPNWLDLDTGADLALFLKDLNRQPVGLAFHTRQALMNLALELLFSQYLPVELLPVTLSNFKNAAYQEEVL